MHIFMNALNIVSYILMSMIIIQIGRIGVKFFSKQA